MPGVASVADALQATGQPGPNPPFRPVVLRGGDGYFVPIALVGPGLKTDWRGLWLENGQVTFLGPKAPETVFPHGPLPDQTLELVNLVNASGMSLLARAEEIDTQLAEVSITDLATPVKVIEQTHRNVLLVRRHAGRLVGLVAELGGPLGLAFPGLADVYPEISGHVDRLQRLVQSVEATLRDIVMMRAAAESNRISEVANRLGVTSNRIGSLANNSNIRMLGIAYLALVVALIGAALLIPETVATIFGMPSATYVPGYWVVVILVVSTAVPLAIIFTRPWMISILRGLSTYEARSQEGLADIPETTPSGAPVPAARAPAGRREGGGP